MSSKSAGDTGSLLFALWQPDIGRVRLAFMSLSVALVIGCGGTSTTPSATATTTTPSTGSATVPIAITMSWFDVVDSSGPTSLSIDGSAISARPVYLSFFREWNPRLTRGTHQVSVSFNSPTDQPIIGFFGVKPGSLVLVQGPSRTLIDRNLGLVLEPDLPSVSYGAGAKIAYPPYTGALTFSFVVP